MQQHIHKHALPGFDNDGVLLRTLATTSIFELSNIISEMRDGLPPMRHAQKFVIGVHDNDVMMRGNYSTTYYKFRGR